MRKLLYALRFCGVGVAGSQSGRDLSSENDFIDDLLQVTSVPIVKVRPEIFAPI